MTRDCPSSLAQYIYKEMIDIGKRIRQKVIEEGHTSVWLAKELGCHRTNVYKIYEKRSIDTSVLLRISRILNYNFFDLYSDEV